MKTDPFPGVLTRAKDRSRAFVLSDEQRDWLIKWFPVVENSILLRLMGLTNSTLHRLARLYGLTKSEAGLRGIRKRQAAGVKRKLERNGYYDTIRGRRPSEACIEGARRRWQRYRAGEGESPLAIMKRKNPRKYTEMMRKKAEQRSHTIKMEAKRIIYGLPRKTKLTIVVLNPFTKSQLSHRYNALKRGYYVMEDASESGGERYNIYYDSQTKRSERFEHNLRADGFTLKEWQD